MARKENATYFICFFILIVSLIIFPVKQGECEMNPGSVSLGHSWGAYFFDESQNLEVGLSHMSSLGYQFTENLSLELAFSFMDSENEDTRVYEDIDGYIYRLDGMYHFPLEKWFVPYLSAGLGSISIDRKGNEYNSFALDYGLGVHFFVTDNVAIRGDLRKYHCFEDSQENMTAMLGLTFYFDAGGQKRKIRPTKKVVGTTPAKSVVKKSTVKPVFKAAPEPVSKPLAAPVTKPAQATALAPVDSDGDGVLDTTDQCPDTPKGIEVDREGCPLDTDDDGVYDSIDQCPDTPAGIDVDQEGCPLDSDGDGVYDTTDQCPDTPRGIEVDKDGCPLDSDDDGVFNTMDQCPGTPRGIDVDDVGCPLDSDLDGVDNQTDRCPDTPRNVEVDAYGCPEKTTPKKVYKRPAAEPVKPAVKIKPAPVRKKSSVQKPDCPDLIESPDGTYQLIVQFEFNKWGLQPYYRDCVKGFAMFMKENPQTRAVIEGHTCSIGSDAYNMKLSKKRAAVVKQYLMQRYNIDESRIETRWYGEARPAADNSTEAGRRKNRRAVTLSVK